MATSIPSLNLSSQPQQLVPQLNSNFQAVATALSEKLTAHRLTVSGYAATGATTTKLALGNKSPTGSTPWAVILVRCRESRDPGKDVTVSGRVNYSQDGGTLNVYEPSGLSQYTTYDLDFLVLE